MRSLLLISVLSLYLHAQTILVINSNSDVKKYNEAVEEFGKSVKYPFKTLDISNKTTPEIKKYLYDEYPDVVYTVGAKAYQYANEYIPEKEIYFSSIVDWKKLPLNANRYGVSNELHSGMQLILIKSIFNNIKSIGIIHSKYTQNIIDDLTREAGALGITIHSEKIGEESLKKGEFDPVIKSCDAMMVISDPLFLNNEKTVEEVFHKSELYKKPVIAYHELFVQYGATLILSVDNPTIGRQIASMMERHSSDDTIEKIQYPAGTKIIFNKNVANKIGVEFTPDIASTATDIVE
ncbi:ABC transporter substrate-binding protein [Sulfuricurvum sp.]|uniref:ABC transporter substrate-binding protein n=1 Tax=Sulfuricurvum sp. TaxID=2025608 RepID=UPI002E36EF8B|nr:ABC transporter substrate binding protein [Sulfuricurvum sp.]HEX5330197.1 ABC transporter substrate binding protein [Sulfuricurvum sp.]